MPEKKAKTKKKVSKETVEIKALDNKVAEIDITLAGIATEVLHHENMIKEFKKIIYKIKDRLGIE